MLHREHYANASQILDRLDVPRKEGAGKSSTKDPRYQWDLDTDYDQTKEYVRTGWLDGVSKVNELVDRLDVGMFKVERPGGVQSGPVGVMPNVPAYLAGQPDYMLLPDVRESQGQKFVTLYHNLGYAHTTPATNAMAFGVAICALVDALESAGARVRVVGYARHNFKYYGGGDLLQSVVVKDHEDPLRMVDVVYQLAHPAFFRRLFFGLMERSEVPVAVSSTRAGYGTADKLKPTDVEPDVEDFLILPTLNDDRQFRIDDPAESLRLLVNWLPDEWKELITLKDGGE